MTNSKKFEITIDFVMVIISFAAFVLFTILEFYNLTVNWFRIFLVFIPVMLFACIYYLHIKHRNKVLFTVVNIILIVIFVLFYLYQFDCLVFNDSLAEVRDPISYQRVLGSVGNNDKNIEHFPASIPFNEKNIRFYYIPPFLQGGENLYLRYTSDEKEIGDLYSRYRNAAKYVIPIDKNYIPEPIQENETIEYYFPQPENISYYVGDLYNGDYDVLILDCAPEDLDHNDIWNHGYSYGLMINCEKRDVIYWSEDW